MTDDEIIDRIREQNRPGRLPLPAPLEAVAELEAAVGHRMPLLLRRIYLEVADGGFGRWDSALSSSSTGTNRPCWRHTSRGARVMARTIRHR